MTKIDDPQKLNVPYIQGYILACEDQIRDLVHWRAEAQRSMWRTRENGQKNEFDDDHFSAMSDFQATLEDSLRQARVSLEKILKPTGVVSADHPEGKAVAVSNGDDLAIGDLVRVFDINDRDLLDGEPGVVVKTGRTLVTITWGPGRTEKFRIQDRTVNNAYGNRYFEISGGRNQRRKAAIKRLRINGVVLTPECSLDPEDVEALVAYMSR